MQNAGGFGLWVLDLDKPASVNQITSGETRNDGESGVTWTADNRIVYSSEDTATNSVSLWARDPDGGNARQLTRPGANTYDDMPNGSPDGRYIVFDEIRLNSGKPTSSRIFRVRSDGGDLTAMTPPDQFCWAPFFTPDGKWILFNEGGAGRPKRLMKMPAAGGLSIAVNGLCNTGWGPDRSGKRVACCRGTVDYAQRPIEFVMDAATGEVKWEKATGASVLRWTPDGELSYVERPGRPGNVFVQPLDGRPAKQITNFETGLISDIAWSPDGRKLLIARQLTAREAYILKNVPIAKLARK
jgi:Tol biopolymer transport system component